MTTDTALRAADAVFMAEQAVGRARRVVDELHTAINSALRVLDDAELDSARAHLSDRGDYYLEAAREHLSRLQGRCNDNAELSDELTGHLERASQAVAQFKPRLAVLGEMVDLAKPMVRLTAQHVDSAHLAAQQVTPPSLLKPVTLERSIATAGKELGRADEDVRLLEYVIDHAAANSRQSAGIASEIADTARRRLSEQGRGQVPRPAAPPSGPAR